MAKVAKQTHMAQQPKWRLTVWKGPEESVGTWIKLKAQCGDKLWIMEGVENEMTGAGGDCGEMEK